MTLHRPWTPCQLGSWNQHQSTSSVSKRFQVAASRREPVKRQVFEQGPEKLGRAKRAEALAINKCSRDPTADRRAGESSWISSDAAAEQKQGISEASMRDTRDPGKSENAWFLRGTHPGGWPPFEFLKMHLYQYTQKIEHCSNKFDFLTLFCLEGLVPNSVLSGSRGLNGHQRERIEKRVEAWPAAPAGARVQPAQDARRRAATARAARSAGQRPRWRARGALLAGALLAHCAAVGRAGTPNAWSTVALSGDVPGGLQGHGTAQAGVFSMCSGDMMGAATTIA